MISSKHLSTFTAVALGFALSMSCAENNHSMTPAAGVAARFSARETASTIAHDRCKHADDCGKIGKTDSEFKSVEDCRQKLNVDLDKKFGGQACENGVGDQDLRRCLLEIKNEDCSGVASLVDTVDRYFACRPGKLCLN